jgi:hypothetical protein
MNNKLGFESKNSETNFPNVYMHEFVLAPPMFSLLYS